MWMHGIWAAKINDFSVTVDCSLFIFTTMVSEVTLHQPRLSMVWINFQNTIDKDLCNFPSFFRNRTCCMRPVDADLRILVVAIWLGFTSKNRKGFHFFETRMSQLIGVVKRMDRNLVRIFT